VGTLHLLDPASSFATYATPPLTTATEVESAENATGAHPSLQNEPIPAKEDGNVRCVPVSSDHTLVQFS
jgi:hypothetical protein